MTREKDSKEGREKVEKDGDKTRKNKDDKE
jgi:hypothetical protein